MADRGKNVLIVYAHPRPGSFNHALLTTAEETLRSCGHTVVVSDLYAMGFDPKIRLEDFEGQICEEVKREVDKVYKADLVLFQFPVYWFAMPAIMKGWLDRVIQSVSNWVLGGDRYYKDGYMKGKKAVLSITTGAPPQLPELMEALLFPIQNVGLYWVGFDVLPPNIAFSPESISQTEREKMLKDWATRLTTIFDEPTPERLTIAEWGEKLKQL